MKSLAKILLLATAFTAFAASPSFADGFDMYWHVGGEHRGPHHPPPGRDFHRDIGLWRAGHWAHGWHEGRDGWWWVIGDSWHLYPAPVYPYPDIYTPPVFVAQPGTTYVVQQPAAVVAQPATVITQPAPTTYISQSAPAPAVVATTAPTASTSQGTEVRFSDDKTVVNASSASAIYVDTQGRTCRDYKTKIKVDGKTQTAKGKACKGDDGLWRTVD
jgi:surface antigen